MRRRRGVVGPVVAALGLAAVVGGLVSPTPALAEGDPAGTVVVASGPTTLPNSVFLEAATPSLVVATTVVGVGQLGRVTAYRRDGATGPLPTPGVSRVLATSGDLVLYGSGQDGYWFDAATGQGGSAAGWNGIGPTGGLFLQRPDVYGAEVNLRQASFDRSDFNTLATFTWRRDEALLRMASGPDGTVIYSADSSRNFAAYVDVRTGRRTTLDLASLPAAAQARLLCSSVTATDVACVGADGTLAVLPLSGAPARMFGVQPGAAGMVVLTDRVVAWPVVVGSTDGLPAIRMRTVPLVGGSPTTSTFPLLKPQRVAGTEARVMSDGTALVVSTGTSSADAAIASVADAGSTPQVVVPLGAAPYGAQAMAVTGNRVVWNDNATSDNPVWTRAVSPGAMLGASTGLGSSASFSAVEASGVRTAYVLPAQNGAVVTHQVSSPWNPPLQVTPGAGSGIQLSGTRVAYRSSWPGPQRIVDVVSRVEATTDSFGDDAGRGTLWGDTYTFAEADGSVWRKDLASSAPAVQLSVPDATVVGTPMVWADWMIVAHHDPSRAPTGPQLFVIVVNTTTGATREVDQSVLAVTPAGYVTPSGTGTALTAWNGAKSVTVGGSSLDASSTAMAWIAADQTVKAAPVPWRTNERARVFGTITAAATASGGGTPWVIDVPTSTPLTSCTVDLLRGATVVRSLPCQADAAAVGDAAATWDLRDAAGSSVPGGYYTWRVRAANRSGALTRADASERPLTGRVRVTA